jgi:hypothetical protein
VFHPDVSATVAHAVREAVQASGHARDIGGDDLTDAEQAALSGPGIAATIDRSGSDTTADRR